MPAHDPAAFQRIERATYRRNRAIELIGERLQVRVFVFADMSFDKIDALFVGHAGSAACEFSRIEVDGANARKVRGKRRPDVVDRMSRGQMCARLSIAQIAW